MENETSFIHLLIKCQGCSYIIENNESLNERTQGHPKTKPKSKLMQVSGNKGRY
jgi:hypothetical protein